MPCQLTYAYLWAEYHEKQRSTVEIAAELGTYPLKVLRALRKFGIPVRDMSTALIISKRKGDTNASTD